MDYIRMEIRAILQKIRLVLLQQKSKRIKSNAESMDDTIQNESANILKKQGKNFSITRSDEDSDKGQNEPENIVSNHATLTTLVVEKKKKIDPYGVAHSVAVPHKYDVSISFNDTCFNSSILAVIGVKSDSNSDVESNE